MKKTKAFNIPKKLFVQAYKLIKANAGAAGIDEQSLKDFERNLKDNLYKLWNRMSSGCYLPQSVKAVSIPKKSGGRRILGVPTIGDRICQMVVKLVFEPLVEPYFLPDSYGYRPNKSALDAVDVTRRRCWHYGWVLEFDIKGLFDNIPHELLMKAVCKHTQEKWILLYIERWLKVPMRYEDGSEKNREQGTPQGGVISPVLSNLFLHYVFDSWMQRNYPETPWCRYADDGVVHCRTEQQAKKLLAALKVRFEECGLKLHPDKTRIVYCKDRKRKASYPNTSFDFLGYTFRQRICINSRDKGLFLSFNPAVSRAAMKSMQKKIKWLKWKWCRRTEISLNEIAQKFNPIIRGWINYYGKFRRSELYKVWRHFNKMLIVWIMRKYKRYKGRKTEAGKFLARIAEKQPHLFAHWKAGMLGSFS